ncbi:MAG: porin [Thiobacillus sp.]
MKKSLIALAVASFVSSSAFAATANVDVYGILNGAVSYIDDQPANINDIQISTFGSRLGFKGSEDLGGGLKAIWQIESSVNFEEGSGTLAGRNSFVGLGGGFGTVLLGNHDTPLKLVGRAVDLFGDTIGDSRNVMGGGSDTRAKNVVAYITPDMGGLGFAAAYSTDLGTSGSAGDADDRGVFNMNATYKNGPLFLGLGYGDGDGHEAANLGAHVRAAAGYTMGALKFVGQYDKLDRNAGDYDAWMAGVAYSMGAITLKANYMDGDFDNSSADPQQFSIGADYAMSKRTKLYAVYTDGEYVTLGGGAGSSDQIPSGTGGDITGLSLGMVHTF